MIFHPISSSPYVSGSAYEACAIACWKSNSCCAFEVYNAGKDLWNPYDQKQGTVCNIFLSSKKSSNCPRGWIHKSSHTELADDRFDNVWKTKKLAYPDYGKCYGRCFY